MSMYCRYGSFPISAINATVDFVEMEDVTSLAPLGGENAANPLEIDRVGGRASHRWVGNTMLNRTLSHRNLLYMNLLNQPS